MAINLDAANAAGLPAPARLERREAEARQDRWMSQLEKALFAAGPKKDATPQAVPERSMARDERPWPSAAGPMVAVQVQDAADRAPLLPEAESVTDAVQEQEAAIKSDAPVAESAPRIVQAGRADVERPVDTAAALSAPVVDAAAPVTVAHQVPVSDTTDVAPATHNKVARSAQDAATMAVQAPQQTSGVADAMADAAIEPAAVRLAEVRTAPAANQAIQLDTTLSVARSAMLPAGASIQMMSRTAALEGAALPGAATAGVTATAGAFGALRTMAQAASAMTTGETRAFMAEVDMPETAQASAGGDLAEAPAFEKRAMHVYMAKDGVHAWIRDADLEAGQMRAVVQALTAEVASTGKALAALVVNGKPVDHRSGAPLLDDDESFNLNDGAENNAPSLNNVRKPAAKGNS